MRVSVRLAGGLLIAMPRVDAEAFCAEFTRETRAASGVQSPTDEACAWIVGDVHETRGERKAIIRPDARVLDVRHTPNPAPLLTTTRR